jgi:hypothetical protein
MNMRIGNWAQLRSTLAAPITTLAHPLTQRVVQSQTRPRQANPALDFAPRRVYFTRTGNLYIDGKQIPPEQFRQNVRIALASLRPGDTLSVEGLSAYGSEKGMLRVVLEEYSRLPANQRPKIELFVSGLVPLVNSPLHNAAKQIPGGVLSLDAKVGGRAAVVLNLGSNQVINLIATEINQLKNIGKEFGIDLPVVLDDHFSIPHWIEKDFSKANGIPIKDGQVDSDGVRSLLAANLHSLSDKVGGIRLSIHGTPESAVWQFNMDIALIAKRGKVDDIEFQIYKPELGEFAQSVDAVVNYLLENPKVASQLTSVKIGMSSFTGTKVFTETEMTQRAAIVEKAVQRIKDRYPNLHVEVSLFPYHGFYKER